MENRKFIMAIMSVLILIITLPAYAEVRSSTFSGDLSYVRDTMGLFNDADIDLSRKLSGSVIFDLDNMGEKDGDRYIENPIQINMMLGTLSLSQNDTGFTTRLYFDEFDNLIGIDFCTSYKQLGNNSYIFKSTPSDNFTSFKIWAHDGSGRSNGTTLSGAYMFNAVPIPAAIWLLGSGLVGLAGLHRKSNKA